MAREEIRQELDCLSHEIYRVGKICTDKMGDATLAVAGEFLKNTSFTIDSIITQLEIADTK